MTLYVFVFCWFPYQLWLKRMRHVQKYIDKVGDNSFTKTVILLDINKEIFNLYGEIEISVTFEYKHVYSNFRV